MRHFNYTQLPEEFNPDYYIPMVARQEETDSYLMYDAYLRCDISDEVGKIESASPMMALEGGCTEKDFNIAWATQRKMEKKVFMLSMLLATTAGGLGNPANGGYEDGMYFAKKPFAYKN